LCTLVGSLFAYTSEAMPPQSGKRPVTKILHDLTSPFIEPVLECLFSTQHVFFFGFDLEPNLGPNGILGLLLEVSIFPNPKPDQQSYHHCEKH